ncbi:MAG: DUF1549 domain-containing protein, partial [Acidobacteriota bacterium]|nr:DUF1549 domain-containing protein [Acidobacteriota bacterium]
MYVSRVACNVIAISVAGFAIYGLTLVEAQETGPAQPFHAECSYFGPERDHFNPRPAAEGFAPGRLTRQFQATISRRVTDRTDHAPGRTRPFASSPDKTNLIDYNIQAALAANNVVPAQKTDDYEFIRRASLDLTGRIPASSRVASFVASTDPAKRAALVEELLAKPEWVDKWTMFYGDLYKNTSATVQV